MFEFFVHYQVWRPTIDCFLIKMSMVIMGMCYVICILYLIDKLMLVQFICWDSKIGLGFWGRLSADLSLSSMEISAAALSLSSMGISYSVLDPRPIVGMIWSTIFSTWQYPLRFLDDCLLFDVSLGLYMSVCAIWLEEVNIKLILLSLKLLGIDLKLFWGFASRL